MKVTVDDDSCRGHGVCAALCPEVFTLTDDGYARARRDEVPEAHQIAVTEAIVACPERAIHLEEETCL
ncbi:ferredoxin [Mycobacterium adipatum]|uniref:ferredoxin n=1 Tax=Mycobacterium adipatum TaxID=1682113 RepID=UPI0034E05EDE